MKKKCRLGWLHYQIRCMGGRHQTRRMQKKLLAGFVHVDCDAESVLLIIVTGLPYTFTIVSIQMHEGRHVQHTNCEEKITTTTTTKKRSEEMCSGNSTVRTVYTRSIEYSHCRRILYN